MVRLLKDAGFGVGLTHMVHGGFPDLVVSRCRRTMLCEVKGPKGKLTPQQVEFIAGWPDDIIVAVTVDDVVDAFNSRLERGS